MRSSFRSGGLPDSEARRRIITFLESINGPASENEVASKGDPVQFARLLEKLVSEGEVLIAFDNTKHGAQRRVYSRKMRK
jgi:hypothetical protein